MKRALNDMTQARLKQRLHYDPDTGTFTWLQYRFPGGIGRVAGTTRRDGYVLIRIDGKMYLVHRLAVLWMTGEWPAAEVDHIDGNPSNNAWENLRDISIQGNRQNLRCGYGRSGLLGAQWVEEFQRWRAAIYVDGKRKFLGLYPTAEAAHNVYVNAKRQLHEGCTI